MKLEFSQYIIERNRKIKFYQICPVGAELFCVDRQMNRRTDFTKLTVAFRNFADAPKNLFQKLRDGCNNKNMINMSFL
jgi:hypothetical protein